MPLPERACEHLLRQIAILNHINPP